MATLDPRTLRSTPSSFISDLKADNKGITDQQITEAWFHLLHTNPGMAAKYAAEPAPAAQGGIGPIRTGFNAARDFLTAAAAKAGQYGPAAAGQALLSKATGGAVPMPNVISDEAAHRAARVVVPQTPAGAVVAAMPAIGPLARAGLLARAGIGAAAGAGANAATGESPGLGAIEGIAGPVAQDLAGGVARLGRWALGTRPAAVANAAVSTAKAGDFARGLEQDVPSLWTQIKDLPGTIQRKLLAIHDPAVIQKALRAPIQSAEVAIAKAVPNIPNPFPTEGPAAPQPTELQRIYAGASAETRAAMRKANPGTNFEAPPAAVGTIPTADAIAKWHDAQAAADAAYNSSAPGDSFALRQVADKWEKAILDAAPDELAGKWRSARAEFGRGMRYQELHQPSLGGQPTTEATPFDPVGIYSTYAKSPSDYAPSTLPGFHAHYWNGAEPGTQPIVTEHGGYLRPPLLGAHGGFHLPLGATTTMPGVSDSEGYQAARTVLQSLARQGVIGLGNQTAEPEPVAAE